MKVNHPEFDHLAEAVCQGRASEDQVRELERLIRADERLCDRYLQYMDLHANLIDDCVEPGTGKIVNFPGPFAKDIIWNTPGFKAGMAGAAAVLVTGIFIILNPGHNLPANFLAVVTDAEGALWEGSDASVMIGSAIRPGMLDLCEGRIELKLDSGVQVVVEGPAQFELLTAHRGMLHRGKLSASVPPEGSGFTVDTPAMQVVDLGTKFGLNVSSHFSEVHVFKGEVEAILKPHARVLAPVKELITTSFTRRAGVDPGSLEPVPFDPTRFLPPPDIIPGVDLVGGGVRLLRNPPQSVQRGTYQHNYALLFMEQEHVELEDPLEVSLSGPGHYTVTFAETHREFRNELKVGMQVDSYFLHYDTRSLAETRCRGMVRFDQPIVAIIACGDQMRKTEELLGSWCTEYDKEDTTPDRQVEDDLVTISGDRRTLTLDWGVGQGTDQIRVLVASAEDL